MNKEKLSASKLIKQSAMQICYFRKRNEEKPITKHIVDGTEYQKRVSISEYKEMRGCYESEKYLLFFAFDEVFINDDNSITLKEHKNIEGEIPDWYQNYSILQTAIYHQLALMQEKKELYTAKFFQKQGYNCNHIDYNGKTLKSVLSMGEIHIYDVKPKSEQLVQYLLDKADHTYDYEKAKKWDIEHKFKDYEFLSKYIDVRILK
jgi:hypothetical protein